MSQPNQTEGLADLSYRGYEGPRDSEKGRWWVIARNVMRLHFAKRLYWVAVFMSSWYFLAMMVTVFITQMLVDQAVSAGLPANQTQLNLLTNLNWGNQMLHGFANGGFIHFLATIFVASAAIANDQRANALLIYLSKPVTKLDYMLGKWVGTWAPLMTMMVLPGFIYYLYGALSYRNFGFLQDGWLLPKFILGAALGSAIYTSIGLAISSMVKQSRVAGVIIAMFFMLTYFFTQVMHIVWFQGGDKFKALIWRLYYASPDGIVGGLMESILGADRKNEFGLSNVGAAREPVFVASPDVKVMLAIGLITILLGIAMVYRKVRAVEVVA